MATPSELDKLRAKTAKTPEDFRLLAQAQGVSGSEELRYWLQTECGLAGDYARRIVQLLRQLDSLALPGIGTACMGKACASERAAMEGFSLEDRAVKGCAGEGDAGLDAAPLPPQRQAKEER